MVVETKSKKLAAKAVSSRQKRSERAAGNPFQNPEVSNLYPNRANEPATPHTRIAKLRKQSKPPKTHSDSLLSDIKIDRREYQLQAVAEVIRAFAEQKHGSVLLRGSSECGKMIMALTIVQHLQKKLGLKVAWAGNPRRIEKLRREITQRGFDVDIRPIDIYDIASGTEEANTADLLVMDQNSLDGIDIVDRLGVAIDPQIVLGLSSGIFLKQDVRDCFDAEVSCTAPVRLREQDLIPQQEKLPKMPVT